MKLLFVLLIACSVTVACHSSTKKDGYKKKELLSKTDRAYKGIDALLSLENEKIVLLSKIQNINYDTLYFILRDYDFKTSTLIVGSAKYNKDSSRIIHSQAIDLLSLKYNLTKKKIAALIFSFKYEMLTREEIENDALENFQNETNDQAEQESDDDPIR